MSNLKLANPPIAAHRLLGQIESFARELHGLRQRLITLDQMAEDHLPRLTAPPMVLRRGGAAPPLPATRAPGPIPARSSTWWPSPFGEAAPLRPAPGFRCAGLAQATVPAIAISCCGLSAEETIACIDGIVAEQTRTRAFVALYLTDNAQHLHLFRHQGLDLELIPSVAELVQVPGCRTVEAFLAERMCQIRETWGIEGFRDCGTRPMPWPTAVHAVAGKPMPKIFFYRDYRRRNPYQNLLYLSMPGLLAQSGEIDQAILALQRGPTAFHLNWEEAIYREAETPEAAMRIVTGFMASLDLFAALGGKLIWTLHNETPHDDRFPEVYKALARTIASRCDLCIVHSARAGELATDGYGLAPDRLCLVPHGGYHTLYSVTTSRAAARKAINLAGEGVIFGFVGAVRPYKNVPLLVDAFLKLPSGTERLLIAGLQTPDLMVDESSADAIIQRNATIPEAQLPETIRACDAIVLPFDQILTSGSMVLALSLGVPVIVPAHPSLCETIFDEVNGLTFKPGDAESLAQTMTAFLNLSAAERAQMGAKALVTAQLADWDWIGRRLSARILALFEGDQATSGEVPKLT
jgi:glycosyltransferase involved in cell wall biosynthesis